jgi:hypothetical protein
MERESEKEGIKLGRGRGVVGKWMGGGFMIWGGRGLIGEEPLRDPKDKDTCPCHARAAAAVTFSPPPRCGMRPLDEEP